MSERRGRCCVRQRTVWDLIRVRVLRPSTGRSSRRRSSGRARHCLFVLAVVLPVGAALDARREWNTDRPEALRLLAFTGSWLGFVTVIAGLAIADPTRIEEGTDRHVGMIERKVADVRLFVNVLLGGSPEAPVSDAGALIARAGTILLLASLILYWRALRKPTS